MVDQSSWALLSGLLNCPRMGAVQISKRRAMTSAYSAASDGTYSLLAIAARRPSGGTMLPHLSLVLFLLMYYGVEAGSVGHGGNCSIGNQRLQLGTYQFQTDCDSMTYCTESGYCERRGCRRDDFPFGYPEGADLPPKCGPGYFCPDEEDQCLPMLAVGSPCQFNRDGKSNAKLARSYQVASCLHRSV